MTVTVTVVGGGIAGLVAADALRRVLDARGAGETVACLEARDRAGGLLRSDRENGFLCEWSANGFLDDAPATRALVERLGLQDESVEADPAAARRYLWRAGRLHPVPTRPAAFLRSGILPVGGRLRALAEPWVRARREGAEESVHEFVERRLGGAAARILADAIVSGVFAGDPRRLSVASCFPSLVEMEREHGSLMRALVRRAREPGRTRGRLRSFRDGMGRLPAALAESLGSALRTGTAVDGVASLGARGFRVVPDSGPPFETRAVVLATPADVTAHLLANDAPETAREIATLPYAPLVVAHLGYHRSVLGDYPVGFGFLVPRGEGLRILGTIQADRVFPARAAEGRCLMTVMLGGAQDPEAITLSDAEIVKTARRDLLAALGIEAAPVFQRVFRHGRALPQYTLGHASRVGDWEDALRALPGLHLAGNAFHGVSVNDCIADAARVADRVLADLDAA